MKIKLLTFGIAQEIIGSRELILEIDDSISVQQFRNELNEKYCTLNSMKSYAIAINQTYAFDEEILKSGDEVAVLPPVSGG